MNWAPFVFAAIVFPTIWIVSRKSTGATNKQVFYGVLKFFLVLLVFQIVGFYIIAKSMLVSKVVSLPNMPAYAFDELDTLYLVTELPVNSMGKTDVAEVFHQYSRDHVPKLAMLTPERVAEVRDRPSFSLYADLKFAHWADVREVGVNRDYIYECHSTFIWVLFGWVQIERKVVAES